MIDLFVTIGLTLLNIYLAFRLGCRVGRKQVASMPFEFLRYCKRNADNMLRQALGTTELELSLRAGNEVLECTSKIEVAQLSLAIGEVLSRIKPAAELNAQETA